MTERCARCGRSTTDYGDESCWRERKPRNSTARRECQIVADGYRRGLREGVEVAKEHAHESPYPARPIGWSDVDAEIARRMGDAG